MKLAFESPLKLPDSINCSMLLIGERVEIVCVGCLVACCVTDC